VQTYKSGRQGKDQESMAEFLTSYSNAGFMFSIMLAGVLEAGHSFCPVFVKTVS